MVFQGFSINIEAGKSTALVGQSGSGKSSVIGSKPRCCGNRWSRCKIIQPSFIEEAHGISEPRATLLAGNIRENIAYGTKDNIDEMTIIETAKAANAHDFISGLTDGYDTFCGDKGMQLSGGEKQRIAIARAILRKPAVLLLDEATSALDSQSEKVLQDALDMLKFRRTSVVVAHRLITIQNCELIVVLDQGKVVEQGTHSSLLCRGPGGTYYSLVNLSRTQSPKI